MSNIVVLDPAAHAALTMRDSETLRALDRQTVVRCVLPEFETVAARYPIIISKDSETGAFFCGAMRGFDMEENLLTDVVPGTEPYRPLDIQRVPFFAAGNGLAVDLDDPRIGPGGQAFFDADGLPTEWLQSVHSALVRLKLGLEETANFIAALLRYDLIAPISLDIGFDDGRHFHIEDVYTINETTLAALDHAVVTELFRAGHLRAVHVLLASLKQIPVLAQRRNAAITASLTG